MYNPLGDQDMCDCLKGTQFMDSTFVHKSLVHVPDCCQGRIKKIFYLSLQQVQMFKTFWPFFQVLS